MPAHDTLDLVIRNADVVTASDRFQCDIGVRDGRIAVLGHDLPRGARAKWMPPACSRCPAASTATATSTSRCPTACAWPTISSPARAPPCAAHHHRDPLRRAGEGGSLQAAVDDYHRRAEGRAVADYGFHLIVADPTPKVLREELPALIRRGYTSFKVYMTYDDLKLSDREMLSVLEVAKGTARW